MDGAHTMSSEEDVDASVSSTRRRKRRRSHSLNESIRRRHAASRVRGVLTVLLLGSAIIATSIYVARNSSGYEPVPTAPGAAPE